MDLWLNVVIALVIIGLVLIQHGKGADMGSGFGSGASGSLFGATGSANFLSRATAVLATLFFLTSLGLAYLISQRAEPTRVVDRLPAGQAPASLTDCCSGGYIGLPMENTTCDVLIIGAGPAGSTAAFLLASRGFKVHLLDRTDFSRPKLCGGLLT